MIILINHYDKTKFYKFAICLFKNNIKNLFLTKFLYIHTNTYIIINQPLNDGSPIYMVRENVNVMV